MIRKEFDRLVVVSNRLPVALKKKNEDWEVRSGSGGLVTALAPVLSRNGGVWMGWPGISEDEHVTETLNNFSRQQGYRLCPIFLTKEELRGYYYGFSNEVLWPLFHGFYNRCNFKYEYWDTYLRVNNKFARGIAENTKEDDYIWVHDYHLMLTAKEISRIGISRNCGFFLHIPFPGPELFLKLPWRREILRGLLEFELLGFQTIESLNNFISCSEYLCSDIDYQVQGSLVKINCGGHKTKAGNFPISVDFDEFAQKAVSYEISQRSQELDMLHPNQQMILGVDRLDYTKGLPQRLEAIRQALINFPDLRGKISLVQIVVPSREEVHEYRLLKEEIERLVGEINGQFTEPGWIPIHYLYRSLPREDLISFYISSEIALVTPLWDGMNLVCKEYCVCNYHESGILILSEFAGAASQLYKDAILVNPNYVYEVAEAIRRAFYIHKSERNARMQNLRKVIKDYDIHFWLDSFLQAAFYGEAKESPQAEIFDYLSKIDQI